jgi:competence protein ComGF
MFGQSELKNRLQTMEWEVFCSQMKKEIRMSTNIQVVSNHLILTEDNGTVTFEKYENILRRRVNNSGHEVVLQNVSDVTFTLLPNRIRISVKDLHDKEYITNVYPFIDGSGTP